MEDMTMAGDEGPAANPTTPTRSSGDQNTARTANDAAPQQPQREMPETRGHQPVPPLPPRPVAPPHPATFQGQALPPPFPGVQFAPLPPTSSNQQFYAPPNSERPRYPGWEKAKLVLGALSLLLGAVIIAIGVAFGYLTATYFDNVYDPYNTDPVVGTAGTAVCFSLWSIPVGLRSAKLTYCDRLVLRSS